MSQWDVQSGDILSGFGYCSEPSFNAYPSFFWRLSACRHFMSQAPSQIFPAILAIPIVEKDRIHRARGIFADLFEDELATGGRR